MNYSSEKCNCTKTGSWPCDCPEKEIERLVQLRVGCIIVEAFHFFSDGTRYLHEKLQRKDGGFIYTMSCFGSDGTAGLDRWVLVETSESDFYAAQGQFAEEDEQQYKIVALASADGLFYGIFLADTILYDEENYTIYCDKKMMEHLRETLEHRGFHTVLRSGIVIEEWYQPGKFYLREFNTDKTVKFKMLQSGDYLKKDQLFQVYSEKQVEEFKKLL